jgi:hypothetical protein
MTDQYKRQMFETYGLHPSHARPCLRVVVGKRCVAPDDCLCHLVDGAQAWRDQAGRPVVTAEFPPAPTSSPSSTPSRDENANSAETTTACCCPI